MFYKEWKSVRLELLTSILYSSSYFIPMYVNSTKTMNSSFTCVYFLSGPKRYDFMDGTWVYKHDGETLHHLLTEEISQAVGSSIDFSECSHSKSS